MQTERLEGPQQSSPTHTVADSIAESTVSHAGGVQSKRQRRVDEWSILVLHSDVKHLEEQKEKPRKEKGTRGSAGADAEEGGAQEAKKQEVLEMARMQEANYLQWKAEQQRAVQIKQAKKGLFAELNPKLQDVKLGAPLGMNIRYRVPGGGASLRPPFFLLLPLLFFLASTSSSHKSSSATRSYPPWRPSSPPQPSTSPAGTLS